MVKFHWQIFRAILNELSKMCSCKWRTLTKWFDKLARCRHGKCDKLFFGLLASGKYDEYSPVIQSLQKQRYVWDSKAKEYSDSDRACDELLQIKWPKEVKPLLYFLIELIQNPNFLPDYNFCIKFSAKQQQYLFSIYFVNLFSPEIYKFD